MPVDVAFAQVRDGSGTQFDPECAQAFLRLRPRVIELMQQRLGSQADTLLPGELQAELEEIPTVRMRAQATG
jgi:HD-GYP domain-containing protein (c-di-GMP phosphodiesterase class II)